jgi:hypothetical protein
VYLEIVQKGCLKLAEMWGVECPNGTELLGVFNLWATLERTKEEMTQLSGEEYLDLRTDKFIEAGRRWGVELTDF